jgi:hypothetical protein
LALPIPGKEAEMTVDKVIRAEIRRELDIAKAKYGENHFEVICIEGGWDDTLAGC